MSMNRGALGDEGVVAVRSYFNRLGYVKAYINSDDTQPVWDGNLFVYNDRSVFSNEHLKFIVPLQVKAHEYDSDIFPETTSYDVELTDLRTYKEDGGVVFFNVLVGTERNQIYVCFLTKSKIQKYLDTAKGTQTRVIKCTKIPRSYTEIITSLRTLHLQRTHTLIPFEKVKKYKNVQWAIDSYGLDSEKNPLEYITSNPVNILAYIEGISSPFYVGDSVTNIKSVTLPEIDIKVGDKVYFNKIRRVFEGNTQTLTIGRSLTLAFTKEIDRISVTASVELQGDTIAELIHEIEFIVSLFKTKLLYIGAYPLNIDAEIKKSEIREWEAKLKFWNDVKDLFALLHIEEPIDNIQQLTDIEINRLKTLIAGLLYGKIVSGKNGMKEDHLEWISFSNIRVLIFARYLSENKYKLVNIFDSLSAFYKDADGKLKTATIYSKIIAEDILASNVDWSNLLKSYQDATKSNPEFFERANWDVLWLIKLYDRYKRISILKAADDLLSWLTQEDNKTSWHNVWRYNVLQIKIRKGLLLDIEDQNWLLDQEDILVNDDQIDEAQKKYSHFSIHVLLSDKLKAQRLFNRLTASEQKFISGLPIYHLYENLINNDINGKTENAEL